MTFGQYLHHLRFMGKPPLDGLPSAAGSGPAGSWTLGQATLRQDREGAHAVARPVHVQPPTSRPTQPVRQDMGGHGNCPQCWRTLRMSWDMWGPFYVCQDCGFTAEDDDELVPGEG